MKPLELNAPGLSEEKARFLGQLCDALRGVDGILSVTFTGSFVEKAGLEGISDIDTVVITERLDPATFEACVAAAGKSTCSTLGLPHHRVLVNPTFGPLKFDKPDIVVIHLMVYSRAGHREHVLKSPFTCLDWERSPVFWGLSLRELYPVLRLQPTQILDSRRSIAGYLQDLKDRAIRYRAYVETNGALSEELRLKTLDERHVGEYAFHIVKNSLLNYYKLLEGENRSLSVDQLLAAWPRLLPRSSGLASWFQNLTALKHARSETYPADTLDRVRDFLDLLDAEVRDLWQSKATRTVFVRHGRTQLNDGRFLGARSDPSVADTLPGLAEKFKQVYSSPLKRALQTAAMLAPEAPVCADDDLREIDYGEAEGTFYKDLKDRHPAIIAAWENGEDPRFPGGENTEDVTRRMLRFLDRIRGTPGLLVVTHNIVLRVLVGHLLGIPRRFWHLIPIAHAEPIEVLRVNDRFFLNLTSPQLARITDALMQGGYRG